MRALCLSLALMLMEAAITQGPGQRSERVAIPDAGSQPTVKPRLWGSRYAVSSMQHQATMAAEHMLRARGNVFDVAVAGQAALAVV